jgi:hypothetical protein
MARVGRLVTTVDIDDEADARRLSVSARLEAVADDGRRLPLIDNRGWTETLKGPGANDIWAITSEQDIADTARVVVGPDEPFDGLSRHEIEIDHWNALAEDLCEHGVIVDADQLKRLPHDVVLSERLRARLDRGSHDAA